MNYEIFITLMILLAAIVMFVTEVLRTDITAITIMLILPWLGLVEPLEAFSGLASNAVIAIIAVMIMGYGLEKSGATRMLTGPILEMAGDEEKRMITVLSGTAGLFSAFMQNIGVVALYLPIIRRINRKTEFSLSRILMPVGFAALLGGNLTMIGSGNLIILNDLLKQRGVAPFNLFTVTPVGLALLTAGVFYMVFLGRRILPRNECEDEERKTQEKLVEDWNLATTIFRSFIPEDSNLVGLSQESSQIWQKYNLILIALEEEEDIKYAPWRFTRFSAGQELLILGSEENMSEFAQNFGLHYSREGDYKEKVDEKFGDAIFAELMIPPRSEFIGDSIRELAVRKNYSVNPVILIRGEQEITGDFSDFILRPGDILVFFGLPQNIDNIASRGELITLTPLNDKEEEHKHPLLAFGLFLLSILLVIMGFQLALALFTGALLMVLAGIIPVRKVYEAVEWQTVFLLTGLIPLGVAMEETGTADFLAERLIILLADSSAVIILFAVAVLASFFTLFMSNVASTVVLVPLVMIMGRETGIDPGGLALLAGVCASNSFILPTHQVNAFFMNAGDYSSRDYIKTGFLMTIIYLVIAVAFVYLLYL